MKMMKRKRKLYFILNENYNIKNYERKKKNYNNWIYVMKKKNDNIWNCKLNEIKDEKERKIE